MNKNNLSVLSVAVIVACSVLLVKTATTQAETIGHWRFESEAGFLDGFPAPIILT